MLSLVLSINSIFADSNRHPYHAGSFSEHHKRTFSDISGQGRRGLDSRFSFDKSSRSDVMMRRYLDGESKMETIDIPEEGSLADEDQLKIVVELEPSQNCVD